MDAIFLLEGNTNRERDGKRKKITLHVGFSLEKRCQYRNRMHRYVFLQFYT